MNDFITIDFETGVYSPESAVSVGLVKYRNYKPVSTYYSLIRPPNLYIRPDFTEEVHGLTVDDVKDVPDFAYLWKNEIKIFIGKTTLAAHNALDDALTCGKLVQMAAGEFGSEKSIDELLEFMGVEIKCLGNRKKISFSNYFKTINIQAFIHVNF